MPRNKKRTTSSKKKKKQSNSSTAKITTPTDLNQILTQADQEYETSNVETALQLYSYAQSILQQTLLQQQEASAIANKEQYASNLIMLSKVLCKIGEIKVSFQNPEDNGHNDFFNGIQLLSQENEEKYLSLHQDESSLPSVNALMIVAQWKESRANLYSYLGQLSSEKDALNNFNHAITDFKQCMVVLEQIHNMTLSDPSLLEMKDDNDESVNNSSEFAMIENCKQLCGAYCSIAELYLTDLCYEPNAEQECENALKLALELDKKQLQYQQQISTTNPNDVIITTPDAVQAMANLRLCQNRPMEAIPFILDAYSRMRVGCEAMADLVGLGKQSEDKKQQMKGTDEEIVAKELKEDALKATGKLPGFEFRCQTAKILLECASNLEKNKSQEEIGLDKKEEQRIFCVEAAIQTLGSLMAENDEVIETWYLLGCAFHSKSPTYHEASKHYFDNALQMLVKTKDQMQQQQLDIDMDESDECSPLGDILEKIEAVKKKIKEVEENICSNMDEDK